jgi:hypothetical protein
LVIVKILYNYTPSQPNNKIIYLFEHIGNCFAACDTSIIATAEGPDLCKLTKSIDELTDLIETVVNEDLSTGIPLLSDIIAIAELFLKNPIAGLSSINDVIKDSQTLEKLLNTSGTEIRRIMDVSNTIINELINVINKLIPNPQ